MGTESFWTGKLPDWLTWPWRWLLDAWALIRVSRFAVLGVLILAAFMLGSDQGRELLLFVADRDAALQHALWFVLLITTFFAFNVWTWARLMVSYRYLPAQRGTIEEQRLAETFKGIADAGKTPSIAFADKCAAVQVINEPVISDEEMTEWMVRLPRILGVLVYVISGGSLFIAFLRFGPALGAENSYRLLLSSIVIALCAVPFYLFVRYRRDIIEFVIERYLLPTTAEGTLHPNTLAPKKSRARQMIADAVVVKSQNDVRERWQWTAWADLPTNTKVYLLILTGLLLAALVWGIADSVTFGRCLGSPGTTFLGLAFWMCAGTWALFWLDHRRFPVITAAFVWALLLNLVGDNHAVRVAEAGASNRSDVATAITRWKTRLVEKQGGDASRVKVLRPVIVATAGGGIRAAYWTAAVLARLDEVPGFRDNLFAMSGVSGGGLGAAAYLAASGKEGCKSSKGNPVGVKDATLKMLSHDFLAPTLAAFFYRDLPARLLPIWFIPDRAEALERSWEHAWAKECPGSAGTFADPFLGLWPDGSFRPSLVINGTMVQTGRRIITSNLIVHSGIFSEAHDFYDYFDRGDVRLSTAVHNGARFTYVSPAGTLSAKLRVSGTSEREVTGQVIDGGYFENFGAESATELLGAVMESLRGQAGAGVSIRPVVIQISSAPKLDAFADFDRSASVPSEETRHSGTLVPLVGFANTRGARGVNAMKRLHRTTEMVYEGTFAHLRLCEFADLESPPLGWVLSKAAQKTINEHLVRECKKPVEHSNPKALEKVRLALQ